MKFLNKVLILLITIMCFGGVMEVKAEEGTECTVFFDANGGNCDTGKKVVDRNKEYGELPLANRQGYTFDGWWTTKYSEGEQITESSIVKYNDDHILYAHWKPNQYTVTYTSCYRPEIETITKTVTYLQPYGELLDGNQYPVAGYDFVGWVYFQGMNQVMVTEDTIVSLPHDHKLSAIYKPKKFKCTFDANGGMCSGKEKTVTYGDKAEDLPIPERTGYNFSGWIYYENGRECVFDVNTYITQTADFTVKAQWEPKSYIITFKNNGYGEACDYVTVYYDKALEELPDPELYTDDVNFDGWFTKKSGGAEVKEGDIYKYAKNITLYAHWNSGIVKGNFPKTSIKQLSNPSGKELKATFKKKKGYSYHIQISTSKDFKKNTEEGRTSKTTYTFKKLKKNKIYYVRVRTYSDKTGYIECSKWSKVKKIKITK